MGKYKTVPLGEIAEVAAGGGAPQDKNAFTAKGTPFVRAGSLNPLVNGASESTLEHLADEVANKHSLRKFPKNTVLFAKSGMSATKGYIYRLRNKAYVVNHLAAITPKKRVLPEYLEHSLRVFSPVRLIRDEAYPSVRLGDISEMKIPLPSMEEQKWIAALLDKADELRRKRRESIAALDSLTQSIFLDLFGDPVTNPKKWKKKPVTDFVDVIRDGPFGSNLKTEHYTTSGVRVIRLQNIGVGRFVDNNKTYVSESHYQSLPRNHCLPGDVLVATLGDPNLRACILPEYAQQALNKADCVLMRPNNAVNSEFLCWLLNQQGTLHLASGLIHGQTRSRISMGQIKQLSLPLPPKDLQEEFAKRCSAIQTQRTRLLAAQTETENLFLSLQQKAFHHEN